MQVDNLHISLSRPEPPKLENREQFAERNKRHDSSTETDISSELLTSERKVDPAEASRKKIVPKTSFQDNPFPTYNSRYKLNPVINNGNYIINFLI